MNDTTTPATPEPVTIYTATLVQGQTYRIRGVAFEYKEPKDISKGLYDYLKKEAVKSVKQGDDDDVRRVMVPMFEYAERTVGQEEAPEPAAPLTGTPKRTRAAAAAAPAAAAPAAKVAPATQNDPFPGQGGQTA